MSENHQDIVLPAPIADIPRPIPREDRLKMPLPEYDGSGSTYRFYMLEILKLLAPRHLTANEIADIYIASVPGNKSKRVSLTPAVTSLFKQARDGWEFVQRDSRGREWEYYYSRTRRESPKERKATTARVMERVPTIQERSETVATIATPTAIYKPSPDKPLAMVIHVIDDVVILLDQDNRLIKGRYIE